MVSPVTPDAVKSAASTFWTLSSNVTRNVRLSALVRESVGVNLPMVETVGATVSSAVTDKTFDATFWLPASSKATPAGNEMVTGPGLVGVTLNVTLDPPKPAPPVRVPLVICSAANTVKRLVGPDRGAGEGPLATKSSVTANSPVTVGLVVAMVTVSCALSTMNVPSFVPEITRPNPFPAKS